MLQTWGPNGGQATPIPIHLLKGTFLHFDLEGLPGAGVSAGFAYQPKPYTFLLQYHA